MIYKYSWLEILSMKSISFNKPLTNLFRKKIKYPYFPLICFLKLLENIPKWFTVIGINFIDKLFLDSQNTFNDPVQVSQSCLQPNRLCLISCTSSAFLHSPREDPFVTTGYMVINSTHNTLGWLSPKPHQFSAPCTNTQKNQTNQTKNPRNVTPTIVSIIELQESKKFQLLTESWQIICNKELKQNRISNNKLQSGSEVIQWFSGLLHLSNSLSSSLAVTGRWSSGDRVCCTEQWEKHLTVPPGTRSHLPCYFPFSTIFLHSSPFCCPSLVPGMAVCAEKAQREPGPLLFRLTDLQRTSGDYPSNSPFHVTLLASHVILHQKQIRLLKIFILNSMCSIYLDIY